MQVVRIQSILTLCLWRNKKSSQCKWYLIWITKKQLFDALWLKLLGDGKWLWFGMDGDWWPRGERPSLESFVVPPMHSSNPDFILSSVFFPFLKILFFKRGLWDSSAKRAMMTTSTSVLSKQWQLIQQKKLYN